VLLILAAYSCYKSIILFNKINPDISKKGLLRDLDAEGPFKPQDYGFDFAFGLSKSLDPSYGNIVAYENVFYFQENAKGEYVKVKERINLDLVLCGSEHFNYQN
jgi:hypothetical protein